MGASRTCTCFGLAWVLLARVGHGFHTSTKLPLQGRIAGHAGEFLNRRPGAESFTPKIEPADVPDDVDVPTALAAIDKLLADFVHGHVQGNLDHDKKFLLAIYGCPKQFGNRMHEFLNDFAIAIVTGRNLVWEYTRQDHGLFEVGTQEECDELVTRQSWIPHRNITGDIEVHSMDRSEVGELGCTEWDQIEDELINPGKMEQYQSYALALDGSSLKGSMLTRAKTLFALGPEIAFGKLYAAAFHFDSVLVTRSTFKTLREAHLLDPEGNRVDPNSMWVGFHMRHKSIDISAEERQRFVNTSWTQALWFLHNRTGSCAAFLATDDDVSEPFLRPLVEQEGCVLVRSNLGDRDQSWRSEHGSHTGVGALREIDLLSGADVLIGTAWSSFTQVIAEIMLARTPSAPFAQCQHHCGFSRLAFPKPTGPVVCNADAIPSEGEPAPGEFFHRASEDQVRLIKIDSLIAKYIEGHSAGSVSKQNGYVAAVYGCPKQFGNRIHAFLNSFAIALITGRNLVWEYTKQSTGSFAVGTQDECDALLKRSSWVPSLEAAVAASAESVELGSPEELACSLDSAGLLFRTHRFESYQALALLGGGALLDDEQRERAKELFTLGPEVAYGKLMRAAFMFDEQQVIEPANRVLREAKLIDDDHKRTPKDSVWVAIHLRHQHETLTDATRIQFAHVVWNQTESFLRAARAGHGGRPCAVLMATDDDATEEVMRPSINDAGCTLVRSALGAPEASWSSEHGNHTGVGALRDIHLLSQADMLVGTAWSSFTQTIAELILSDIPRAPFAQCNRQFCVTTKTAFPHPDSLARCAD